MQQSRLLMSMLAMLTALAMHATTPALAQRCLHPDFKVDALLKSPAVEQPAVVTCDDDGNLFVGEDPMSTRGPATKEIDRVLHITFNPDGTIKRKTVFADKLASVGGLIWHDGALYVMHSPHYTRFTDTNNDGVADTRQELVDGLGPPAGAHGHNQHIAAGIRLGIDRRVYVAVGDKGIQRAVSRTDKSKITLEGGGVVRMTLDGGQLEIFSRGARNHRGVAMDSLGNVFTYDGDDGGLGWEARFIHHVATGNYGYPFDLGRDQSLPWIDAGVTGEPGGGACYQEAAWPAKYRQAAFFCERELGSVRMFTLARRGAAFEARNEDFLVGDNNTPGTQNKQWRLTPTDLCFSPDGRSMYVTAGHLEGADKNASSDLILRVTYIGKDAATVSDSPFIARPGGELVARGSIQERDLIRTLAHPAHSQRMLAQWELSKRGLTSIEALRTVLTNKSQSTTARIHALWALFAIAEGSREFDPVSDFLKALHNSPDDLRSQAARAIGTRRLTGDGVTKGLIHRARNDRDASVRLYAAVALGRLRDRAAATDLFASLDDEDDVARFAKIEALKTINAWETAPAFLHASEKRTRLGAVSALRGVFDETAVAALAQAATDNPYKEVRIAAIEALATAHRQQEPYTEGWWGPQARGKKPRPRNQEWAGTAKVVTTLRSLLTDSDEIIRLTAIRSQEEVRDKESLPTLRELATKDASAAVRQQANRVLELVIESKP